MSIEWNKQSFQALKELWQSEENELDLSDNDKALTARYGGIECMVESDRIWPVIQSPARQKFNAALREVLSRCRRPRTRT